MTPAEKKAYQKGYDKAMLDFYWQWQVERDRDTYKKPESLEAYNRGRADALNKKYNLKGA